MITIVHSGLAWELPLEDSVETSVGAEHDCQASCQGWQERSHYACIKIALLALNLFPGPIKNADFHFQSLKWPDTQMFEILVFSHVNLNNTFRIRAVA